MQTVRVAVHVIEVRELPGKDAAGLCDPFVRVTVAGAHRKQTAIRYGHTSTAFDEQFSFPEIQLSKEDYERSNIRIEVFDAKVFFRNELIGQCVFGIPSIRNLPKHEIHQQWVQLEHPQYAGSGQGFVRVSITVYGENDRPTGHATSNVNRTLREIQMEAPSSQIGLVLGNPSLVEKRRGYNFVIKALRAEHLLTEGNTFLAIRFNGVMACTPTKARSKNPDWNYQLTMAVFTPRFSDVIEIELWSSGVFSETLIASTSLKFSDIISMTYPPTWFNFYGAPPEDTGLAAWWAEMIQNKKVEPTAYLGRALLSMSATLTDAPQVDERLCEPLKGPDTEEYYLWVDVLKGCELLIPNFGDVQIEVQFGPSENTMKSDWCKETMESLQLKGVSDKTIPPERQPKPMKVVHFSCPSNVRFKADKFAAADSSNADSKYAQFKEVMVVLPRMEPTDGERQTKQLWDLIINVFVRDGLNRVTRVGFVRIKPEKIWGFDNDPEWFPVRGFADKTSGASESQGFLLVSAQFGPKEVRNEFLAKKERVRYSKLLREIGQPYEIRAYIYQARNLPPTDPSTGLASSYVEMSIGGALGKRQYTISSRQQDANELYRTTTATNSLNPIWYDTLIIRNLMLPQTDASTGKVDPNGESIHEDGRKKKKYISLALAPDIELVLKTQGKDELIGRIRFPTQLATRKYWPKRAKPRWIKFFRNDATTTREDVSRPAGAGVDLDVGELLVKLEAIPQDYAERRPWYNRHRWPKLRTAKVFLATVGLRNMFVPGVRKGEDDGRGIVQDDVPTIGPLQVQVPLFPDMRAIVKSALDEYDATKMKVSTGGARVIRGGGGGMATGETGRSSSVLGELRLGLDGGGDQDKYSDEESLDSDEKEEMGEGDGYDDEPLYPQMSIDDEEEAEDDIVDLEKGPDFAAGGTKKLGNISASLLGGNSIVESKQLMIAEKVRNIKQKEFAEATIEFSNESTRMLYRYLPSENRFSFFKIVAMTINYPEDEFYAPSMTVRVLQNAKNWYGKVDDVFGSCVIPLRPFSTEAMGLKPVDQVLRLPYVALSKIGKDEFEAMARRDSDFTNSTIQTPKNRGAAAPDLPFDSESIGSGGSESTIHSIRFREVSNGSIMANDEEDPDLNNDEELDIPNGWPGKTEMPMAITLNNDKLNVLFDVEVNAENRKAMAPVSDANGRMHASMNQGLDDDEGEETIEDQAERENKMNDLEKERQIQENKVLRELEEFTGVFWPVGASRKQLLNDCVERTLEEDDYAIKPLAFEHFPLKKGFVTVPGKDETVGIFKAVLEVNPVVGENASVERPPQVLDVSQLKNMSIDLPADSRILKYLNGGFDDMDLEMGWKPEERIAHNDQVLVHRLEDRGPEQIKVRIYVVQGTDFWSRNPDKCRPYLQLEMKVPKRSKESFTGFTALHDDSFNQKEGINAFFGSVYELDARFPDVTQLEIRAYDASPAIGGPDFIGSTTIDLEDRWFNPKWQIMKEKKRILKEFRPLFLRNSTLPRGTLEMWVEMYTPLEAVNAKVTDIRMPKNDNWELRLVVWETHNVPPPEDSSYISMYVTTELSYRGLDGKWRPDQYQSTDTHWWVDNGVGSFNWRNKFKLEVPCRFPRLTFKVWQTDLITVTPDQVVGTATVDIDFLAAIANAWEGDEPYERPRMIVKLTQDRGTAQRGDLEVQISLVRERIASMDPVGFGRDPPNKDPFLPEPKRKSFWAMFFKSGSWYRCICCLLLIIIPIVVVVPIVLTRG